MLVEERLLLLGTILHDTELRERLEKGLEPSLQYAAVPLVARLLDIILHDLQRILIGQLTQVIRCVVIQDDHIIRTISGQLLHAEAPRQGHAAAIGGASLHARRLLQLVLYLLGGDEVLDGELAALQSLPRKAVAAVQVHRVLDVLGVEVVVRAAVEQNEQELGAELVELVLELAGVYELGAAGAWRWQVLEQGWLIAIRKKNSINKYVTNYL